MYLVRVGARVGVRVGVRVRVRVGVRVRDSVRGLLRLRRRLRVKGSTNGVGVQVHADGVVLLHWLVEHALHVAMRPWLGVGLGA